MEAVADWLYELHGNVNFWVGALDQEGNDLIKWIVSENVVLLEFWGIDEPDFNTGDCVLLNNIIGGLAMGTCQGSYPALCEV